MKMYKTNTLIEAALQVLDVLENDPTAQTQLEAYGFGAAHRQVGQQRLSMLQNLLSERTNREQERWALSQQINAGLKAVRDQLREHARIARFALNDDQTRLHSLKIDKITLRTWECVEQAIFFYQQLQQQNIALDKFGLSKKEVQQSLEAATTLLKQKKQRIRQKGRAEQGTQQIQQAQAALRDWLVEFRGIARVAYRQQPQLLEMFGMPVRSSVKGSSVPVTPESTGTEA